MISKSQGGGGGYEGRGGNKAEYGNSWMSGRKKNSIIFIVICNFMYFTIHVSFWHKNERYFALSVVHLTLLILFICKWVKYASTRSTDGLSRWESNQNIFL